GDEGTDGSARARRRLAAPRGRDRRTTERRARPPGARRPGGRGRRPPRRRPASRRRNDQGGVSVRVVIADDEALFRDGLRRVLEDAGVEVVDKVATASELLRRVQLTRPDAAIVDIRMPPSHTDEGLVAAQEIRHSQPAVAVLVLSHYLESHWAMRLIEEHPE